MPPGLLPGNSNEFIAYIGHPTGRPVCVELEVTCALWVYVTLPEEIRNDWKVEEEGEEVKEAQGICSDEKVEEKGDEVKEAQEIFLPRW